jgi:hypothetical protein
MPAGDIYQGEVVGKIVKMVEYAISIPDVRFVMDLMNINGGSVLFKKF